MRRVSSRPRLVSFDDNFENVSIDLEYGEDEGSFDTALQSLTLMESQNTTGETAAEEVGRKRDRVERQFEDKQRYLQHTTTTLSSSFPLSEPPAVTPSAIQKPSETYFFQGPASPPYDNITANMKVPSLSCFVEEEEDTFSAKIEITLESLPNDVQLHVASYLDAQSLRQWGSTHRSSRKMLLQSPYLWKSVCLQQHWTHLNLSRSLEVVMKDALSLPTAAAFAFGGSQHIAPNLPLLLSMTPGASSSDSSKNSLSYPTHICKSAFPYSMGRRGPPRWKSQLALNEGQTTVQYQGIVGTGDRCIRANAPLPKPIKRSTTQMSEDDDVPSVSTIFANKKKHDKSLLKKLCRGAQTAMNNLAHHHHSRSQNDVVMNNNTCNDFYRPFVVPFCMKSEEINVTPRFISYFEVDIRPNNQVMIDDCQAAETDDSGQELQVPPASILPGILRPQRHPNAQDCVAIGLATERFSVQSRMPGWDANSFGYHGDDGGTFHNSGGMVEEFGPSFGPGDVVGCGIDYVERGIFFTLNGKFLGYGWKNLQTDILLSDLYPVVGIDTNAIVECNFGTSKPFVFDLPSMMDQHSNMIRAAYQFAPPPSSCSISSSSSSSLMSMTSSSSCSSRRGRRRRSSCSR